MAIAILGESCTPTLGVNEAVYVIIMKQEPPNDAEYNCACVFGLRLSFRLLKSAKSLASCIVQNIRPNMNPIEPKMR